MPRKLHPNKDIEAVLRYAEDRGWTVVPKGGHAWGRIKCPFNDQECRCGEFCISCVWSTPRSPTNHARQLRRVIDKCVPHMQISVDDRNDEGGE